MLLRHDVDHLILDPLSPSPDMISEGILVESKFRIQSIPLEERVCLSVAENAVPIVLSYLQAIGIPASVSTIPTRLCEEYPTLSAHGLFRECVNLLTKSKVKELVDLGYFDGLWDGWAQSLASVQVEAAEIELVKGRLLEGSDGIFVHTLLLRQ
jgi:hypothetical protein